MSFRAPRNALGFLSALLLALWAVAAVCSTRPAAAGAREVISPQGLRVWLVEDHSSPVLTLGFRFAGGAAEDPPGKEGVAHAAASMFFAGGGALGTDDYLARWAEIGAEYNIEAKLESLRGTVRVLSPDRDKAIELLGLAVNQPRFDAGALDQIRDQIAAELDRDDQDPESFAFLAYDRIGFARHARARPVAGTREGIAAIEPADIQRYRAQVIARDGLSLAAIGDITATELGPLVDRVFAALPPHSHYHHVPVPPPTIGQRTDLVLASNQAEVVFGAALPGLNQREVLAAELLNYTLGGSAFTSRLYHEVREKRGLTYSIGTSLDSYNFMTELSGSFAAEPAKMEEAIALVRQEFAKLATAPPTDDEIAEAKVALAGEFLRGILRQADLANELTLRQSQHASPDYVDTYAARLAAISPEEVRVLAGRIPWLDRLIVVTVSAHGSPDDGKGERSRLHAPPAKEP